MYPFFMPLTLCVFALTACTAAPAVAAAESTAAIVEITVVGMTPTNTPARPAFTRTPAPSASASPTAAPPTQVPGLPRGDGTYLVGPQMARGIWHSDGSGTQECYYVVRKANGIILDSYYGPADTPLRIEFDEYDYQINLQNCGVWTLQTP